MTACPNCGQDYREGAKFCHNCGKALVAPGAGNTQILQNPFAPNDQGAPHHTAPLSLKPDAATPPDAPQSTPPLPDALSTEATHIAPLGPGTIVYDRYTVLDKLGEGGLGRAFLAQDGTGRHYVVKQIRERQPDDADSEYEVYIRSFQREAHILSSLPHPYLPIVRDFIITPDNLLIVMDYIEGKTLSEVMSATSAPIPEKRVLRWAIQVCEALSYLHSKKPPIIHRNIKPKNIILEMGEEERVRLIGFGLARFYADGLVRDEDNLGTPGYSPPEQYGMAQTDARSDIFGLGATIFAMLSGGDPGDYVEFLNTAHVDIKFPNLHKLNPQVSKRTSDAVMRALQTNPGDRYQSADEMKAALEDILMEKQTAPPVDRFVLNQIVPIEETRNYEFKEVKGDDPVWAIRRIVDQYVVAFLNSEGGRIYWGIRDDRMVTGVKLSHQQRDQIRRMVTDKIFQIQPAVAPSTYRVNIHPVLKMDKPVSGLFVVEVIVYRPATNLLYFTSTGEVHVKTDAGKKKLTGSEIHDEIRRRLQKGG